MWNVSKWPAASTTEQALSLAVCAEKRASRRVQGRGLADTLAQQNVVLTAQTRHTRTILFVSRPLQPAERFGDLLFTHLQPIRLP